MSDPRLYEWIALRRINGGGVAKSAGVYFDHGRPVPTHMVPVFDRLRWSGLIVIAEGDPIWDLRRVSLTEAGRTRYGELSEQREQYRRRQEQEHRQQQQHRHMGLEVPGAEFGREQTSGAASKMREHSNEGTVAKED